MPLMNSAWRAASLAICAAVIGTAGLVYGQATSTNPPSDAQRGRPIGSMMVDESQATAMMAQRQQMMARMRALDQKLNELVAKMDAAKGTAKVETIATVVKELVAQRAQLRGEMMAMQGRMMGHMMQHMMSMQGSMMGMMNRGSGRAGAAPSPMETCPMMKGLSQEAPQDNQDTHHPENKK